VAGEAVTRIGQWLRVHEDPAMPVRVTNSVAEIRAAKAAGDTAVVLHFQGCEPLRSGTDLAAVFARLGVRVIQPTYNYRGPAGDGCCEPGKKSTTSTATTSATTPGRRGPGPAASNGSASAPPSPRPCTRAASPPARSR